MYIRNRRGPRIEPWGTPDRTGRCCSDLVSVPRVVSEEIWTSCLAGVLCNQSLIPKVTTVWLKWPISFYSGKDLCIEGEVQLLLQLYSTRAALPTLPIDGCHKGLTLHHPLKPCHSSNSGNCQNNKSFFAVYCLQPKHTNLHCQCIVLVAIYFESFAHLVGQHV